MILEAMLRREDLTAARDAVRSSQKRGDRTLVEAAEQSVQRHPGAITFDEEGFATLESGGARYAAGRFAPRSLRELTARLGPTGPKRFRLSVITGQDPLSDIGALQADAAPGTLFQAASQFNCLESPDPFVTSVVSYLRDPTQGPRASISAFPGTLVRHYAAPRGDGRRFVQTDGDQLNLLESVCAPDVAVVESGYLMAQNIQDPRRFLSALEGGFESIQVGVHESVEVVLGYDWDGAVAPGKRISQVFTSTLAGGGYSDRSLGAAQPEVCRLLLFAAYRGTLLAAAATGQDTALLTLIGGGVFENPPALIWAAILDAVEYVERLSPKALHVVVNARGGLEGAPADLAARVRLREGFFVDVGGEVERYL